MQRAFQPGFLPWVFLIPLVRIPLPRSPWHQRVSLCAPLCASLLKQTALMVQPESVVLVLVFVRVIVLAEPRDVRRSMSHDRSARPTPQACLQR